MSRILSCSCFFVIACTVYGQGYRGVHLAVTIRTTSDWCRFEPAEGAALVTLDYEIVHDESPNEEIGTLAIFQSGNTNLIEVTYSTFLLLDSLGTDLNFVSTKGDWGDVTITVDGYRNGQLRRVEQFENHGFIAGDPSNRREFSIPAAEITALDEASLPVGRKNIPHTVFSFYYPWYGSPSGPNGSWFHWDPDNHYASTHEPILGYYDSGDSTLQIRHLQWAEYYGVDVFICSWWGIGSYEDRRFPELLESARSRDVKLTVYFETNSEIEGSVGAARVTAVKKHFRYVLDEYSDHPSFFRFEGAPVIFLYGLPFSRLSLEEWAQVLADLRGEGRDFHINVDSYNLSAVKLFDGFHTYNPLYHTKAELRSIFTQNQVTAGLHEKVFGATILPGYDDTVIREPGIQVAREDGAFYSGQWDVVAETQPAWVLITSWNEWHEGSEIETSVEYGGRYLQLTREGRDLWDASYWFTRGDVNADKSCDISDAVFTLAYLFANESTPICVDAADANDDGEVDISDAIMLLGYLFGATDGLPEPFPHCGADPTPDQLTCRSPEACSG